MTNHRPARTFASRPQRAQFQADWTYCEAVEEYTVQLQKDRAELIEALRFALHYCDNVFATAHDPSDRDVTEYKRHSALLRELGEIS